MSNSPKRQDRPDDVDLNLDSLEREGAPKPYTFVLGGRRWTTRDPLEMDWQEVMALNENSPADMVKALVTEPEEFLQLKLPTWKLDRLAVAMRDRYFGQLGDLGNGPASTES